MKRLIALLMFILMIITGYAQRTLAPPPSVNRVNDGLISSNDRYGSKMGNTEISYDEALAEYENIDGSPFLHGGEITVDLIRHNDTIIKNVAIRYDLYNKEVIAKTKNGKTIILNQLYYKGFTHIHKGVKEQYLRVHPTEDKFFKVFFQNEDFVFCQDMRTTVSKDTRYVPGQEIKNKKFVHNKTYQVIQGDLVNKSKLRKGALIKYLPWKYRKQVPDLKKKLSIKQFSKERDYLILMKEFENI